MVSEGLLQIIGQTPGEGLLLLGSVFIAGILLKYGIMQIYAKSIDLISYR